MLRRILWTAAGLAAGVGLYLPVINRILSHLRFPPIKRSIAGALGVLLLGGFGRLGFANRWGRLAVTAALAAIGVSEIRYRRDDRRLRASPPVERSGPQLSLRRPFTTTDLVVERYEVSLPGADGRPAHPGRAHRLRVAHISDLHLNDHLPKAYYQRVVEVVAQHAPDLVFITGDFVSEAEGIEAFPELVGGLPNRLGIYGIFGNHDYWAGVDPVAEVVRASGVTLLGGSWIRLEAGPWRLLLAGCEEPWGPGRLELPPLEPDERLLVLSHSADTIYHFSQAGAGAVFTGHFHAGQFHIPGFGPLFVPSRYGRRFYRGHYQVNGTHLFVSAGIGAHEPPWRLYCPPDVLIVDLYAE